MELTFAGGRYVARTSYDERAIPKAAGFRWDPAGKHWWTDDVARAAKLASYADDGCRTQLEALRERQQLATAASRQATVTADEIASVPVPAGLALYPYQVAGTRAMLGRDTTLLADEMGLGKTVQAIALVNSDPSVQRVLILCPAHLRLNWARECERWLTRRLPIVLADVREWPELPGGAGIVIAHYEAAVRHWTRTRELAWDVLVADEAHFLKNAKAQRTVAVAGTTPRKGFMELPSIPPIAAARRLYLTGSPVLNRPRELYPLLRFLDPTTWREEGKFLFRYCGPRQKFVGRRSFWDFSGSSHEDELQERLRETIMVRRLKADVLTELPPKRRQVLVLPANGTAKAIAAEQKALAGLLGTDKALTGDAYVDAVLALRGDTAAFNELSRIRHETALAKVEVVAEHVREALDERDKVVVFVHHHDVAEALRTELAEFGAVVATGEQSVERRQAAVDSFQADPAVRVMVASIYGAGTGFTMTAASLVVFAELAWTPGDLSQAEDRCHRIGQRDSVLVQHLVLEGSLDERMAQVFVAKQRTIARITDEPVVDKVAEAERAAVVAAVGRLCTALTQAAHAARDQANGPVAIPDATVVPAGYYAIDGTDGAKNATVFFRVDRPTTGKWAGKVFVSSIVGGHAPRNMPRETVPSILARIAEAGWQNAQRRYGVELGICGACGRELTDDVSRQFGIGPVCRTKGGF